MPTDGQTDGWTDGQRASEPAGRPWATEQARRASEEAAALGGPRIMLGEPWSQLEGPHG